MIHILTGKKFGMLTPLIRLAGTKKTPARWLCKCDCGNETSVTTSKITRGYTKSCGCFRAINTVKMKTTHGLRNSAIYRKWASMKNRCLNEKEPSYRYYGGRGITVCGPWINFENFYADMGDTPKGCELDRIDVNGPYSKSNCRWVSRRVNANNKRNNHRLTFGSETKNIGQWAAGLKITPSAVLSRIENGWPLERALTEGRSRAKEQPKLWRHIAAFGKTMPLKEWCEITGLKRTTVTERLKRGMAPENALSLKVNKIRGLP